MKLGSNKDQLPAFIEQQAKQIAPSSLNENLVSKQQTSSSINYEKYSFIYFLK